jgi:hypothetical protein
MSVNQMLAAELGNCWVHIFTGKSLQTISTTTCESTQDRVLISLEHVPMIGRALARDFSSKQRHCRGSSLHRGSLTWGVCSAGTAAGGTVEAISS